MLKLMFKNFIKTENKKHYIYFVIFDSVYNVYKTFAIIEKGNVIIIKIILIFHVYLNCTITLVNRMISLS